MTDYAEHLEKELLAARSELAELRKRVCVPEGWKVERDGAPIYVKPIGGAGVWLYPDGEAHERVMWAYFDALLAAPPAPAPVERVEQEAVSYYERAHGEKSPTHGMNLGERIAHVGGRTNAAGYMEFGSVMAVSALIDHVLRDSPAPQPAAPALSRESIIDVLLSIGGQSEGVVADAIMRMAAPAPDVAGLVDRIVPRIDAGGPNPINPDVHCCEWTLHKERERIHSEFADALDSHQSGGAK